MDIPTSSSTLIDMRYNPFTLCGSPQLRAPRRPPPSPTLEIRIPRNSGVSGRSSLILQISSRPHTPRHTASSVWEQNFSDCLRTCSQGSGVWREKFRLPGTVSNDLPSHYHHYCCWTHFSSFRSCSGSFNDVGWMYFYAEREGDRFKHNHWPLFSKKL